MYCRYMYRLVIDNLKIDMKVVTFHLLELWILLNGLNMYMTICLINGVIVVNVYSTHKLYFFF